MSQNVSIWITSDIEVTELFVSSWPSTTSLTKEAFGGTAESRPGGQVRFNRRTL